MGKYIVEVKDGETLYKAVIAPDGEPYITPAMGNVYTEPDLEQVRCAAYEEGRNSLLIEVQKAGKNTIKLEEDEYYQRGLNDAWEAARKIAHCFLWGSYQRETGRSSACAQAVLDHYSASEAIEKIRQYEQKEKITKGDVVRLKSAPEVEILVTYVYEEHVGGIALTEVDDSCEIGDRFTDIIIHKVEKTGRHYEIAEVLKKMREE